MRTDLTLGSLGAQSFRLRASSSSETRMSIVFLIALM